MATGQSLFRPDFACMLAYLPESSSSDICQKLCCMGNDCNLAKKFYLIDIMVAQMFWLFSDNVEASINKYGQLTVCSSCDKFQTIMSELPQPADAGVLVAFSTKGKQ